ncbi:phage major capsid protein [Sphingomonas sp.]|uniref:phage major capsid protein n=1 Tax=Sphingomonas sp. TaxID=28214 RepID=UPI0017DE5E04|nr:phage major capsid protein [Sphingomonas sp.]MBA3511848.1 phage major capsid protein [Sphingomonas sp.]
MTVHFPRALAHSGFRVFAEQKPEELFRQLRDGINEFKSTHNERLDNIEAAVNALGGNALPLGITASFGSGGRSWGDQVVNSEGLTALRNAAGKARAQIELTPQAAITSVGTSGGPLFAPDRVGDVPLARRRLTVRALLGSGRTDSNMVEYPRQTTRDNQAATVAEGALKPESNLAWELKQAKVATIAHWVGASRQALDDAGQLRTLVDGELRYGLALKEESQLLLGDGVGTNVLGLIPQATAYDATGQAAGASKFDVLLRGVAQAEAADLPATGVVVNSADWFRLQGLKDTQGRYIGSGPLGSVMPSAWGLDVVPSNSMPAGKFLVGNFANSATIYDRQQPVVLLSTEDRDNFIRNMVTILCEERIALAVRRPEALIYGDYAAAAG